MLLDIVDFDKYYDRVGVQKSLTWEQAAALFEKPKLVTNVTVKDVEEGRVKWLNVAKHYTGFVFWGKTNDGRKRLKDIVDHSAVALDYDNISGDGDEFIKHIEATLKDFNYMYYSTSKNRPGHLRLRVIIPLLEPVSGDKYKALARMIISGLGRDGIDVSSIEDNRAMGYTARLRDAEYLYKAVTDKAFLNPDEELTEYYTDWQDKSQWPLLPGEDKVEDDVTKEVQVKVKTGPKREKTVTIQLYSFKPAPARPGDVKSCFNAVFSCRDIFENLKDYYEPFGDRYRYYKADAGPGVWVSEDGARCGSYHSNSKDPLFGRSVTAFDLWLMYFTDSDASYPEKLRAAHTYALESKKAEQYKKLFFVDRSQKMKSVLSKYKR